MTLPIPVPLILAALVIFIGGPLACLKWRNELRRPDPHAAPHGDVPNMGGRDG